MKENWLLHTCNHLAFGGQLTIEKITTVQIHLANQYIIDQYEKQEIAKAHKEYDKLLLS